MNGYRSGKRAIPLTVSLTSVLLFMLASCAPQDIATQTQISSTQAITKPVNPPEIIDLVQAITISPPSTVSTNPSGPEYDYVQFKGIGPIGVFNGMQMIWNLDFATLKQSLGQLWLPEYLPYGLTLQDTALVEARELRVTYSYYNVILMITETPCGADLKYLKGSTEVVSINGHPGYLVHGNWEGYPQYWSTRQLQIIFNIDGWIVAMSAISSTQWSAAELIKVAESLKPY